MKNIIFILMLVLITSNLTAQGLTKHGEITNTSTVFIDKNGKIGSIPALNQSGAVAAAAVSIGTQTWTARNLEVTTYRNGDPIRYAGNIDDWTDANTDKEGAWCYYADAEGNNANYGKLYNWYAVNDGRGLAPEGWHIPSDAEWTKLRDFLGGESVAGEKLKEAGTSHWKPTNDGATNESGFTALPGGYRFDDGAFDYIGSTGFWWSSSEYLTSYAWGRYLSFHSSILSGNSYGKGYGFSIRCVKDVPLTSIAPISGTPNVGSELTAGALSPTGASATYQWTICSTVGGTYTNIPTATSSTYTPVEADLGKFIKVVATGSDGCTGTVTSDPTSSVSLSIGYSYGGGKVAYILQSGDPGYDANITKGLIAATEDQSTGIEWITGGSTQTTLNDNTLETLGSGQANTNFMIAQADYTGGAAKVCDDYSNDGFSDWYLPSQDELVQLYYNRTAIGGFLGGLYWSSTEKESSVAYSVNLDHDDGTITSSNKSTNTIRVRAVRSFAILPSITISSQTWSGKNLDVEHYRNGDVIPYVDNAGTWASLTTGAWCYYSNNSANGAIYGKIYNWYAVNDSRGLAPAGWHVASDAEWTTLGTTLGGADIAGQKLKEAGTTHWPSPNTGATNEYGFTALPGGYREPSGTFMHMSYHAYWWTSTFSDPKAWYRDVTSYDGNYSIGRYLDPPRYGFPVRCIRD